MPVSENALEKQFRDHVLASTTHPCRQGHDYQPRHDMRQCNHLTEMVYVRDVCVRCGETLERPQKLRDY